MMNLTQVSWELEKLLDDGGIDEGWFDWLREFIDHIRHPYNDEERLRLRHEILLYEKSLFELSRYLPANSREGCSQKKLWGLLRALDDNVRQELWR